MLDPTTSTYGSDVFLAADLVCVLQEQCMVGGGDGDGCMDIDIRSYRVALKTYRFAV
jgi:hypothetical protein